MSKKTERGILIIIGLVLNPYELDFYQFGSYADAYAFSLALFVATTIEFDEILI